MVEAWRSKGSSFAWPSAIDILRAAVCDVAKENVFATNLNCFKARRPFDCLWDRGVFPGNYNLPCSTYPNARPARTSRGGIAQLVARQLCQLEVRGSNPLASSLRSSRRMATQTVAPYP